MERQDVQPPLLSIDGLSKTFGATRALDNVSLDLAQGQILALVGHNGSGKSTLVKILAGAYERDQGVIETAPGVGLHFIHQDLALVEGLSAVENFTLRHEKNRGFLDLAPIDLAAERRSVQLALDRFGLALDINRPLSEATPAQRAIVAIARAMSGWQSARNVLILDEPTESLHSSEVGMLFAAVRAVAEAGAGIIFISHRLDEVLTVADRVIVLSEGKVVAEESAGQLGHERLLHLVTGQEGDAHGGPVRANTRRERVVLDVSRLSSGNVVDVDLELHSGEIVGIAGVLGSGREDIARALFGAVPSTAERFRVGGAPFEQRDPASSIARGIAYVPADRGLMGGVGELSARENITLPNIPVRNRFFGGALDQRSEQIETDTLVVSYGVRPATAALKLRQYSGGNQQKIVFAKWLRNAPDVVLLEEPTQGVDMGAKQAIYATIRDSATAGAAVVICSSDAKELLALCDRVLVLRNGRIGAELSREELSENRIVRESYGIGASTYSEFAGDAAIANDENQPEQGVSA